MKIDRFFSVFKTASTGMAIQRKQLATTAENIANAYTTKVDGGEGPYKPKTLVQSQSDEQRFQRSLTQSILQLRNTRGVHLQSDDRQGGEGGMADLGPDLEIVEEERYRYEYDPKHPDADENGMVKYPDLDMVQEMTNMVSANRLYEANLSVVEAEKQIIKRALEM